MTRMLPIVLASASPRRAELLWAAGLRFEIAPVEVGEDLDAFTDPVQAARELARRKALEGARRRGSRGPAGTALVIGADTVVAAPAAAGTWRLLGKPADPAEARAMLAALSGTRHQVVSGVCVARSSDLAAVCGHERTWVSMRALEPAELEAYVASGEWQDKAGGYAIQDPDFRPVDRIEGCYCNVVGLPLGLLLRMLREARQPLPPVRRPSVCNGCPDWDGS